MCVAALETGHWEEELSFEDIFEQSDSEFTTDETSVAIESQSYDPVKSYDENGLHLVETLPIINNPSTDPPKAHTVRLEDFEILQLVGKGAYGKVHQVRKISTKQIYAMKVMRKERLIETNNVSYSISERNILQNIQHHFIASLHYAFQTKGKVYLVMDFLNGGPLLYHMRRVPMFSEELVRFYAAELVLALEYLHSLDIIHRDLKPENILLWHDGHLGLADFGLAKLGVTGNDTAKTFCGTIEYMAPEIIRCVGHGKASDWWSLGVLIYDMLTGHPPFRSKQRNLLQRDILLGKFVLPYYLSQNARSIISGLLTPTPENRLGFKGAQEIKVHPFFQDINWEKLARKEVTPPFNPNVPGLMDTTYFERKFLNVNPGDSPLDDSPLSLSADPFLGFSYVRSNSEHFQPPTEQPS